MTLQATEQRAPAGVIDIDGRPAQGLATGGGKNLQFVVINTAAAGATTLVAAAGAGLKIKVVSYTLVSTAANAVSFLQAATPITGAMALAANGGVSANGSASSHLFETPANALLAINLSGATQVSGHLSYFVE